MANPSERHATDRIIGEVLASRYRIEARLGEGAMGTVYKARHVKVGRAFAVKVLHPDLLEDTKVAQRFAREAELAGRLRHPNVVGVVDVGETADGLHYMVMEFAEGPDLATMMVDAPFTGARVMHLTRQLLEGLFHAHEQGLIHRDFKPENVIVEKDTHGAEMPRIVDFGIAILREGGDSPGDAGRLTTNGLVLGTPHYMAPEQAIADPIDHRIDLFALGIVIYEMLCGQLPFDGTGVEVARANLLLEPPPISVRVPHLEVDPLLEAFARKLMAKKRETRPPTAKAARDLLDLIDRDRAAAAAELGVAAASVGGPPVTAPSAPQPRLITRELQPPIALAPPPAGLAHERDQPTESIQPISNKRPLALGIGLGAALLAGGIVVASMRGSSQPRPPIEKVVAVVPPDAAPIRLPAVDAGVEEVALTPAITPDAAIEQRAPRKHPKPNPKQPKVEQLVKPRTTPIPQVTRSVPLDANALIALYTEIGAELRKAGADTEPFNKWRLIRIYDHIKDPTDIAMTATKLRNLRADGASLAKQK